MIKIENKLNIWQYTEYSRWYRIDRKLNLFFRKIKWMFQRAKYGYCDMDLWSLFYTLGNYIASTTQELKCRTHGYPLDCTEDEWMEILQQISNSFYLATNEECWTNPYEEEVGFGYIPPEDRTPIQKEALNKWIEKEIENDWLMNIRLQEGFQLLNKWFYHLWD